MAQTSPMGQTTQDISKRLVVEDSIEVKAPIQTVYNRWNDFTRFPDFMSNVEEVRPISGNRYHWVARIFGIKQEWDAEVTEREPERRISWRSLSGPYNAGTVSFSRIGPDKTEVRVRFEYTPPAGNVGKTLDALTKATHREVREDLKNFKRVIEGKKAEQFEEQTSGTEIGNVLGALAVPIATGIVGGLAYNTLRRQTTQSFSFTDPTTWISVPTANLARFRYGAVQTPFIAQQPVSTPAAVLSWTMLGATAASILGSASLRFANRRHDSLFVGQWAPTFLGLGLLTRMLGHRGVRHDTTSSTVSWGLLAACLGAIGASAFHHIRGKQHDGLFVGQWAPTFLMGAVLFRLFNR